MNLVWNNRCTCKVDVSAAQKRTKVVNLKRKLLPLIDLFGTGRSIMCPQKAEWNPPHFFGLARFFFRFHGHQRCWWCSVREYTATGKHASQNNANATEQAVCWDQNLSWWFSQEPYGRTGFERVTKARRVSVAWRMCTPLGPDSTRIE